MEFLILCNGFCFYLEGGAEKEAKMKAAVEGVADAESGGGDEVVGGRGPKSKYGGRVLGIG